MPVRSKWQSLPTEAINPATLAIDKLSAADIVEGMLNEDRKMLAAVQREKDRIAVGIDIITQALRQRRPHHLRRRRHQRPARRARVGGDAADLRHRPDLVQAIMAGGKNAVLQCAGGRRGQLRGRRAVDQPPAADQEGRRHRRVGERHDAVRPRRADARAPRRLEDHLRHLRSADRAADVRRSDDRAGGRPRGDRRIDAAEGRARRRRSC